MHCELNSFPWPHLVIDGFLSDSVLADALSEIRSYEYEFELEARGHGRIEFSLLRSKQLWRSVYSKNTISLLKEAFDIDVTLDKHNMLQLRRMNDDTPRFPIHTDYIADAETIASFLYLSPGWQQESGGRLNLFENEMSDRPGISLDPIQNRFVAFQTSPRHWHSVDRVYGWERLAVLALWAVKK